MNFSSPKVKEKRFSLLVCCLFIRFSYYILTFDLIVPIFLQKSSTGLDGDEVNVDDSSKFTNYAGIKDWKDKDIIKSIRNRFVTGEWPKADERAKAAEVNNEEDDGPVFGDFEDLETGEKHDGDKTGDANDIDSDAKERMLKKLALRAKFEAQYP